MGIIDELRAEHHETVQHLTALEAVAEAIRTGAATRPAALRDVVTVLRRLAAHHNAREEQIVFAAMVERGFAGDAGPIAILVREHAEADRLLTALAAAAARTAWTPAEAQQASDHARGYASLMRRHMLKEETNLFPLAQVLVPPHVMARFERQARMAASEPTADAAPAGRTAARTAA
ncbi:MAG TPA: hemerythrin domain-containing protein [Polyangia bacterium]